MKIGIIIPTRGNRPEFLNNCLRQLNNQTLKHEIIELVDYSPESNQCDITQRYRRGYEALRNKGLDIIALIEDDEYYSTDYLETIVNEWVKQDRPDLFGTTHTIYYHIKLFAWLTFHHHTRSSAMSTLIVPDLNFKWCHDTEPYFDIHIWREIKNRKLFCPPKHICLGIKHGIGMTGGRFHNDRLERYEHLDPEKKFLSGVMDAESFDFFTKIYSRLGHGGHLAAGGCAPNIG